MLGFLRNTFLLVLKSKLLYALLMISLLLLGVAAIAGEFSGRQPQTVALDVGLSFVRFVLPSMGILLCGEYVSRDTDRKTLFVSLSYPVSRSAYLLGRFGGICIVLAIVAATLLMLLAVVIPFIGEGYNQARPVALDVRFILVGIFIVIDAWLVTSFALLLSSLASNSLFVLLGGASFLLIGRTLGGISAVLKSTPGLIDHAKGYLGVIEAALYIIPDLAHLDLREAALYSNAVTPGWPSLLAMPLFYMLTILLLASWRFETREFA